MLTQSRVKELFKLDKKGRLVRKITINNKAKAGEFSTSKDADGYLVVGIDKNFIERTELFGYMFTEAGRKEILITLTGSRMTTGHPIFVM